MPQESAGQNTHKRSTINQEDELETIKKTIHQKQKGEEYIKMRVGINGNETELITYMGSRIAILP